MHATGPRTDAGKAASARNAVRHGLLSEAPVVTCLEKLEDWQTHREEVLADLNPRGRMEICLAERAALLMWRLRRLACAEAEAVDAAQEPVTQAHSIESARSRLAHLRALGELGRNLAQLPGEQVIDNYLGTTFINYTLEAADLDCAEIAPPGLEEVEPWDHEVFTAARLREAFSWIAQQIKVDEGQLQTRLQLLCEEEAVPARGRLAEYEAPRGQAYRRVDLHRLEVLARYEAHLGRELARTMKALRDLQARPDSQQPSLSQAQQGGAAPADNTPPSDGSQVPGHSNGNGFHLPRVPLAAKNCETNPPLSLNTARFSGSLCPVRPLADKRKSAPLHSMAEHILEKRVNRPLGLAA